MIKECMNLLNKHRKHLTRQQINTFKGQIFSGDFEGFKKGLFKVIKKGA